MKLQKDEYRWARWPRYDRVDHIYHGAGTEYVTLLQHGCEHPIRPSSGELREPTGRRCRLCTAWLAQHPEVDVNCGSGR